MLGFHTLQIHDGHVFTFSSISNYEDKLLFSAN